MDFKKEAERKAASDFEVHRVSPFEFYVTSEPCVMVGVEAATSVVYATNAEPDPEPFVSQNLTFQG